MTYEFDPKMPLTAIWVDFHVGQNSIGDNGEILQRIFLQRGFQISTLDASNINRFRLELHKMLDHTIDVAAADVKHMRKYGVKHKHRIG